MSPRAAPEVPHPPSPREERLLGRLLRWSYVKGFEGAPQDPPPPEWGAQPFGIPRTGGGVLAALLFPHPAPRGVVLFGHPGVPAAKGYFHRGDRIPFVRDLGFTAVTFDHGGFGESDPTDRLYHVEWSDVLAWARRRFPGQPLHLWGVSVGGYFAHHALAAPDEKGVASAVFEQVAPDLLRYREAPGGAKVGATAARLLSPAARLWLPAESHALHVKAEHVLYVSGEKDQGIPVDDAKRLFRAASPLAAHHVVPDADHLEAWKEGGDPVRDAVRRVLAS